MNKTLVFGMVILLGIVTGAAFFLDRHQFGPPVVQVAIQRGHCIAPPPEMIFKSHGVDASAQATVNEKAEKVADLVLSGKVGVSTAIERIYSLSPKEYELQHLQFRFCSDFVAGRIADAQYQEFMMAYGKRALDDKNNPCYPKGCADYVRTADFTQSKCKGDDGKPFDFAVYDDEITLGEKATQLRVAARLQNANQQVRVFDLNSDSKEPLTPTNSPADAFPKELFWNVAVTDQKARVRMEWLNATPGDVEGIRVSPPDLTIRNVKAIYKLPPDVSLTEKKGEPEGCRPQNDACDGIYSRTAKLTWRWNMWTRCPVRESEGKKQ